MSLVQAGGASVIEAAIAEVMTAEDSEAASRDRATQDPQRGRDPRLPSLFSPRLRQAVGGQEMDANFYRAIEQLQSDHVDPALPGFSAALARAARNVGSGAGAGTSNRQEAHGFVRALQDLVQALQRPDGAAATEPGAEGGAAAAENAAAGPSAAPDPAGPGVRPADARDPVFQLLRMVGAQEGGSDLPLGTILDRAGRLASGVAGSAAARSGGEAAPPPASDADMADVAQEPVAADAEPQQQAAGAEASPEGHAPMDVVRERSPQANTTSGAAEAPPPPPAEPPTAGPSAAVGIAAADGGPVAREAAGTAAQLAGTAEGSEGGVVSGAPPQAEQPAGTTAGAAAATDGAAALSRDAQEPVEEGVLTACIRERATAAGLDVSMLEGLPSDMVRETLLAYGVNLRDTTGGASEAAAAAEDTRAALEGIIPPELLNEGLQAERDRATRRLREFSGARQGAAAGDAAVTAGQRGGVDAATGGNSAVGAAQDFATMIMSFPADVREDALASLPANVVEELPASLRSQAQRLQGRRGMPSRMREAMGHHLGRIGAGTPAATGHRHGGRDITRGESAALHSLMSGTLDNMPSTLSELPGTAPCEELSVESVRVLIKLNACAAALENESALLTSSSRPDIHDGVTAILVGCLPTQQSVSRVCSLFMEAVASFLTQPRAAAPPSSAPVRRLVLGLDTTRAAMCPQANDAALVLTGLLGTLGDLSKFDGHVAQCVITMLFLAWLSWTLMLRRQS